MNDERQRHEKERLTGNALSSELVSSIPGLAPSLKWEQTDFFKMGVDPKYTLGAWAEIIGAAPGTLRLWLKAAGMEPLYAPVGKMRKKRLHRFLYASQIWAVMGQLSAEQKRAYCAVMNASGEIVGWSVGKVHGAERIIYMKAA